MFFVYFCVIKTTIDIFLGIKRGIARLKNVFYLKIVFVFLKIIRIIATLTMFLGC
jgi:hypothetical protein